MFGTINFNHNPDSITIPKPKFFLPNCRGRDTNAGNTHVIFGLEVFMNDKLFSYHQVIRLLVCPLIQYKNRGRSGYQVIMLNTYFHFG